MALPSYFCLLQACIKCRSLVRARLVLTHLILQQQQHGASLDALLRDYVVLTLARCGGVEDALSMAQHLCHPLTLFSWNALISSSLQGDQEAGTAMYLQMRAQGVEPNLHTFVPLIHACGRTRDVERGKRFHVEILERGEVSHSDAFLTSSLIALYAKCRAVLEADEVFRRASELDVVSWNAMLSGYRERGESVKAMKLYRQLQEEADVVSNEVTLVIGIQICGDLVQEDVCGVRPSDRLEIGRALHSDVRKKNLASSLFVGSSLLVMYKRMGSMAELECVFASLSTIDVVACNVMLSAYVDEMEAATALRFYTWMRANCIHPDKRSFVFVLRACGAYAEEEQVSEEKASALPTRKVCLEIGKALHDDACQACVASFRFVSNTLVSMYGKCGAVHEAEHAFLASDQRDIVLWTSMLCVYVENGEAEKALLLYRQMHHEGVPVDEYSLMFLLQACAGVAGKVATSSRSSSMEIVLEIGRAIHSLARKKGFMGDLFLGNSLVSVYAKCGVMVEAECAFAAFLQRSDTALWNALISEYVEQEKGEHALQLYAYMQGKGVSQDHITHVAALLACSVLLRGEKDAAGLDIGHALHSDACKQGFAGDGSACSALISMYGRCGSVIEAEHELDSLSRPSAAASNAMLSIYAMRKQEGKALELYESMQKKGMALDELALVRILRLCGGSGCVRMCWNAHFDLVSAGRDGSPSMVATLIHAYGSCASTEDAGAVLDGVPEPDTVIWNAFLSSGTSCHHPVELQSLCGGGRLGQEGLEADGATFASILILCCHAGLVKEAMEAFVSMQGGSYGLTPDAIHYCIMADVAGRAGDLRRLESMIQRCKPVMHGNAMMWSCVLAACRARGNVDLAEHVFDCAKGPKQPSMYVLLSNVYAVAGLA